MIMIMENLIKKRVIIKEDTNKNEKWKMKNINNDRREKIH